MNPTAKGTLWVLFTLLIVACSICGILTATGLMAYEITDQCAP